MRENRQGSNAKGFGHFPSDDTKLKMKKASINKKFTIVTKNKMAKEKEKTVYQYDLNGNLINVYHSATDASINSKTNIGNLCACCRNIVKRANGFFWSYNYIEDKKLILDHLSGEVPFQAIHTRNEKPVYKTDHDGNILEYYHSIKQASELTGIAAQEISQACKNNKKVTRQYKWRYAS